MIGFASCLVAIAEERQTTQCLAFSLTILIEMRKAVGDSSFFDSSLLTGPEKFPLAPFRHHVPLSIGSRAESGVSGTSIGSGC